jgi:hypothetical protein
VCGRDAQGCFLKRPVYRLLADGWLNRPTGRPGNDGRARILKKTFLQHMASDRRSRVLETTWMGMKNDLEDSQKIFSKIANANRFL